MICNKCNCLRKMTLRPTGRRLGAAAASCGVLTFKSALHVMRGHCRRCAKPHVSSSHFSFLPLYFVSFSSRCLRKIAKDFFTNLSIPRHLHELKGLLPTLSAVQNRFQIFRIFRYLRKPYLLNFWTLLSLTEFVF